MVANRQSPIYCCEKLSFKHVQLREGNAAYFSVEIVGAERIAEAFASNGYSGNDESMTGERGQSKQRHPAANLVDVMESQQKASFLRHPNQRSFVTFTVTGDILRRW